MIKSVDGQSILLDVGRYGGGMIRLMTLLGKRKDSGRNGNLEVAKNYTWLQNIGLRQRCMLPRN